MVELCLQEIYGESGYDYGCGYGYYGYFLIFWELQFQG